MKKIIAYKGYYVEFMAKLSEQERRKIQRAVPSELWQQLVQIVLYL